MQGTITSVAEVTHVSKNGFWILLDAQTRRGLLRAAANIC